MATIKFTPGERSKHHPWCHRHNKERRGCKVCLEYYVKYPVCIGMEYKYCPTVEDVINDNVERMKCR